MIAFGGRVLPGSDNPAKYLNSPETPIFSKSKTAFGIDLARSHAAKAGRIFLPEESLKIWLQRARDVANVQVRPPKKRA